MHVEKTKFCVNCKAERHAVLYRQFSGNGAVTFLWMCATCNRKNPDNTRLFIPKEEVEAKFRPDQIESFPTLMPPFHDRCVRCGARGTELHHWAPKGIFGADEAEQWPKDCLCKACHDEWHLRVTPQLTVKP